MKKCLNIYSIKKIIFTDSQNISVTIIRKLLQTICLSLIYFKLKNIRIFQRDYLVLFYIALIHAIKFPFDCIDLYCIINSHQIHFWLYCSILLLYPPSNSLLPVLFSIAFTPPVKFSFACIVPYCVYTRHQIPFCLYCSVLR